jgi:GT2 family glycosyltransferase
MTTFSLIVLAYNSGRYLDRCLTALSAFDAEIICADNGSTDGTDFDALKAKFPNIQFRLHGENLGFAAGNNRAAAEASGEWLGFINPDAFAEPGWLSAMRAAIAGDPEARLFTSLQLDAADLSKMDGAGDAMTFFGFPYRMGFGQPLPNGLPPADVFGPCGAAFVIHRDLWHALGGFDERFFTYCEDADLGFRARLLGHACRFVPGARVAHVGSASTSVRSDFALYHGYRNRVWLYLKNMPLVVLIPTLPLHIGLTLSGAIADTLKGRGGIVRKALGDALSDLGPILEARKIIMKSKRIEALRLAAVLTWNPAKIARRALDHRRLR